ncbi:MAG TPA: tRNA (adenosine(37)-N6)-threonylcarbamoyltransferase complex ATPase subunit type 1 TsaE [Polyangiales bacterium]|nr:tRNA (adenosine(37)-N6)-threonylcarbamoyltransferase complex ATPase subunit type 1 TsaE [Polyangiales bacterium]
MLELQLDSEAATLDLARALSAHLQRGDVIGLEGDLGSGKTTFTRGAVHGLGVPDETPVTSPTFALVHRYRGRLPIAHADLYRLSEEAELEELGLDELLEEGAVLFVEWGRRFPEIADRAVLWVELDIVSDEGRRARLRPQGPRGEALIDALQHRRAG